MCAGNGDLGDELGVVGGGPGSSPGAAAGSGGGECRDAGVMQNSRHLEITTDALSFAKLKASAKSCVRGRVSKVVGDDEGAESGRCAGGEGAGGFASRDGGEQGAAHRGA